MKVIILITVHYSYIENILDEMKAVNVKRVKFSELTTDVYLDNLDNDRWEYLLSFNKLSKTDISNEIKSGIEVINDVDFTEYFKNNRGKISFSNLNLI